MRFWLATLLLLLAACASPEERAAVHVERGAEELSNGEVKAALLEFQSALKLRPGDAALYTQIGDVLFDHSEAYEESLAYYQEARRIDPDDVHAKMREARLVAFSNPKRSRELIDSELLYRSGVNPEVLLAEAYLELTEGDLDAALISAREAVRIDEYAPQGWAQLGQVYMAKISARNRRGQDPGVLLFGLALGAFDQVEKLKGGEYPRARLETARVYWFQGQRKRARLKFIDAVNLAVSQGNKSETLFAIETTLDYARRVGDDDLVRRMLRQHVEVAPRDYRAWEALGEAYDAFPGHTGEEIHLELIEREPDEARPHVLYAVWLMRHGREQEAEAHLERSRADGIDAPAIAEALVQLALRRGDLASARGVWAEMVENDPEAPATKIGEARIALADSRPVDAENALTELVSETPTYESLRLLALAQQHQGKLGPARRTARQAVRAAPPPKAAALRLAAEIELEAGDWSGALRSFEQLTDAGQTLSAAEQAKRARALHHAGRGDEARALIDELASMKPPAPRAALVFWELRGEAEPERTYTVLKRAHSAAPMHNEVIALLTDLDLAEGRPGASFARLSKLVDERIASPFVLLRRAEVLSSLGALSDAEADVLRALEANPALPGTIDLLHRIYTAQGRLDEARRSFEQADEAGVLHAGARQLLARLYREAGDEPRARETLERVVSEAPELWTARADLAFLLSGNEDDLPRARELANSALADSGGDPHARAVAGWVDLRSGRPSAALSHLEEAIAAEKPLVPGTLHYWHGLALLELAREADAALAFERALADEALPEAEEARAKLEAARRAEAPAAESAS